MTPLATFRAVRKSYDGETDAVGPLDLDVAPGEFLTLLGPSGSGKTTTLMMLAGFETPTAGAITLDGRPMHDVPAHRRGIGVVFQNYALFPHMTVAENLAFPLQMRAMRRADIAGQVRDALATVRLDGLADRRPAQLSGGQQQRVALARALIFRPKLVLMDEPLGALDKQLREHMQAEIRHLHRQLGLTVVYVTHDQTEALTMADRVAVFHAGQVQQAAPPATIYDRPATEFVACFIGENNRLHGTLLDQDGTQCRVQLPGGHTVSATAATALAPGSALTLCIRPEQALIGPVPGALPATLREIVYHGDHDRLHLVLSGQPDMVVKQSRRGGSLQPGDAVPLSWPAHACLAFPRSA